MKAFFVRSIDFLWNLWDKMIAFFGRFSRRAYGTLALVLVALVLVVDVGYHFAKGLSSELETMPAKVGSLSETVEGDMYLIRDEKSLSYDGGKLLYYAEEGEKVQKGTPLYAVFSEETSTDAISALSAYLNVEKLLSEVVYTRPEKVSETLKTKIAGVTLAIENALAEGNIEGANREKATLSVLLFCREELVGAVEVATVLAEVQKERQTYEALCGTPETVVTAEEAGWFSRICDGYEVVASASAVSLMNYTDLAALFEERELSNEGCAGKMISSHKFYTVTFVNAEIARAFSVNKKYTLTVDAQAMTLTLDKVLYQNENEGAALLFSGTSLKEALAVRRISQATLPTATHEGFKLPAAALSEYDGVYGVYILKGFVVEFREVSVAFRQGNTVVVSEIPDKTSGRFKLLAENDNVIIRGEDLFDGKIIH